MTPLPDGTADWVIALWVLSTVGSTVLLAWFSRGLRKDRSDLVAVREQVENDHPTNLRNDMDRQSAAIADVAAMVEELIGDVKGLRKDHFATRDDVAGLRGEIRDVRLAQTAFERRVADLVRKVHPDEVL